MARKQKTIHYLYKITCLITEKYYIGMHSTNNLEDNYMGSGKILRYSIRKYGDSNHKKEILEFFETRELLIEAEKKAITSEILKDRNSMNMSEGGGGWNKLHNLAFKKKLETDENFRKSFSEKSSNMMKQEYIDGKRERKYFYDWSGKKHSEETKLKLSQTKKGKYFGESNSQFGTCWITKDGVNKKIKKEELDLFITDGWNKGRVLQDPNK